MVLKTAYKIVKECGISERELEVGNNFCGGGTGEVGKRINTFISRQMSNMDFEAREFGFYYGNKQENRDGEYKFYVRLIMFSPVSRRGFLEYVRVYKGKGKRVEKGDTYLVEGNWGYREEYGKGEFKENKKVKLELGTIKMVLGWLGVRGHVYSSMVIVGK